MTKRKNIQVIERSRSDILLSGVYDEMCHKMREEGCTAGQIAQAITAKEQRRFSEDIVRRRLAQLGLNKRLGSEHVWQPTAEDDEIVREAWAGLRSLAMVRRQLGVTDSDVYRRAHQLRLGTKVGYRPKVSDSPADIGPARSFATPAEFEKWQGKLYAGRRYDGRTDGGRPDRQKPEIR